jgi:phosphoglycolate phosphatase
MNRDAITTLVFDWDGTLIDSIDRIVDSLQYASKHACGIAISQHAARNVIGLGLLEAISELHPQLDSAQLQAVCDAYKQHYLYESEIEARLFDGVEEMLAALQMRGFTLAIATGKSRHGLDHALRAHSLEHFFASTRCAGENKSKPHPEMLLGVLEDVGASVHDALMIGDSEHDLRMAINAGVASVAVTHGVHSAEVLRQHQPLVCLDRITELSAFLTHNPPTSTA